jgi:predicted GNAT family N-acyltransferase
MTEVLHITQKDDLNNALEIRRCVFVEEQNVPAEAEYDEFENTSRHFLAFSNKTPCGTARWRFTDKGIKLERFAVLKEFRNHKIGSALVAKVLEDVAKVRKSELIYLHAQVSAMGLYRKFGFEPVGEMFLECEIEHFKMVQKS